jgi:hypothetical protein
MIEQLPDNCISFTGEDFDELLAKWRSGYRDLTPDENTMLYSGIISRIDDMAEAEAAEMEAILEQLDEQRPTLS